MFIFIYSRLENHQVFFGNSTHLFVYYETIKRELNRRLIYECRCDERLKSKDEVIFTSHIHWVPRGIGTVEHPKIETRLIDESFSSVMNECVILTPQAHSRSVH